jgi:hypothetical protein
LIEEAFWKRGLTRTLSYGLEAFPLSACLVGPPLAEKEVRVVIALP